MELVGSEFKDRVLSTKNVWWPARDIVRKTVEKRFEVSQSIVGVYSTNRTPASIVGM